MLVSSREQIELNTFSNQRELINNYYNNGNNKQKEGKTMVESAVKQVMKKKDTPQIGVDTDAVLNYKMLISTLLAR